ncbi:unnamed protein product [Leptosia nina]|uniref:unspecific monooxygenase n=1 Tax=Leptosia nina TaxID=320188 RepID=A0AAV1JX64_9NEOP
MILLQIVISLLLVYLCIYLMGKYNETYWLRRGVPFYKRNKITGVYWDFVFRGRPVFEALRDVYRNHSGSSAVGLGFFLTPAMYVSGAQNLRYVLATASDSFNHRAVEPNRGDLLADNVLFMHGARWKLMRQALTPLFTTRKLRDMYYIIDRSARDFAAHLQRHPDLCSGRAYRTLSTFCSAAIGAAVFGISPSSIFDSPFLDMAQKAFEPTFWSNTNLLISNLSLELSHLLGIKLFKEHEELFVGAIRQVIAQRRRDSVKRHDFAELCVTLQRIGRIADERIGLELKPTDELLAAQAFFFFIAGVEPTASALFGALYELGRHPECLKRLHTEIDETFAKCDELTIDTVAEMSYLNSVVCEAMRIHPPVGYLKRLCVRDALLPDGAVPVARGTRLYTPVFDVHHDPRHFPQPDRFDPERFSPENKRRVSEWTYMPFGRGSRVCIGQRYALLQVKAGLAHVLRRFSVTSREYPPGQTYSKQQLQVRLENVDVRFLPRHPPNANAMADS